MRNVRSGILHSADTYTDIDLSFFFMQSFKEGRYRAFSFFLSFPDEPFSTERASKSVDGHSDNQGILGSSDLEAVKL